ncbi:MAG: hypothetical protein JXA07_12265 [Spirochaetes bacterium]|nr:hypothetical protein [Spirochaetota bacterium]
MVNKIKALQAGFSIESRQRCILALSVAASLLVAKLNMISVWIVYLICMYLLLTHIGKKARETFLIMLFVVVTNIALVEIINSTVYIKFSPLPDEFVTATGISNDVLTNDIAGGLFTIDHDEKFLKSTYTYNNYEKSDRSQILMDDNIILHSPKITAKYVEFSINDILFCIQNMDFFQKVFDYDIYNVMGYITRSPYGGTWQVNVNIHSRNIRNHKSFLWRGEGTVRELAEYIQSNLNVIPLYRYYYLNDEYDKIIDLEQKTRYIGPQSAEIYNYAGLSYLYREQGNRNENYEFASDYFNKAIQINESYSEAHNNLGIVYLRMRLFDKALSEISKALELNKSNINAYYNLAAVREKMNDRSGAREAYQKYIALLGELDPQNSIIPVIKAVILTLQN